jgi:hypothetical protein
MAKKIYVRNNLNTEWIPLATSIPNASAYATYEYVDNELANIDLTSTINTASAAAVTYIVDAAPSTLDTLNELAAALNDDANFASTVATSLGNKLDISTASSTYLTQANASTIYQEKVLNVDNTEIGYLNNASANIQTQLNAKANLSGATFTGNIISPEVRATTKLVAQTVGGDEGGEILLGKAATNTTLTGDGVTIDVFQNRLRIFEQGGDARGGYIDVSRLGNGVSTDLTPGMVLLNTTAFTAQSSVSINNVFNSTYDNYKITFVTNSSYGSGQVQTNMRLRSNGTNDSSGVYFWSRLYSGASVTGGSSANSATVWEIGDSNIPITRFSMDIHLPAVSSVTSHVTQAASYQVTGPNFFLITSSGMTTSTTSYDGFSIIPTSGTMTGTIKVYGYK